MQYMEYIFKLKKGNELKIDLKQPSILYNFINSIYG